MAWRQRGCNYSLLLVLHCCGVFTRLGHRLAPHTVRFRMPLKSLRDTCAQKVDWSDLPDVLVEDLLRHARLQHKTKMSQCFQELIRPLDIFTMTRQWMDCRECRYSPKSWLSIRMGDCEPCKTLKQTNPWKSFLQALAEQLGQ